VATYGLIAREIRRVDSGYKPMMSGRKFVGDGTDQCVPAAKAQKQKISA
jgi:hypothetical protein